MSQFRYAFLAVIVGWILPLFGNNLLPAQQAEAPLSEREPALLPTDTAPFPIPDPIPASPEKPASGPGFAMPGAGNGPGYSVTWLPSQSVFGQPSNLSVVRQDLNIGLPVWKQDGRILLLTTRIGNSLFDTDAILPDTERPFPDALWQVNFGAIYIHRFENGWTGGLMPRIGSDSDKPFDTIDDLNIGLLGFLRVPVRDQRDAWMFSIMYSSAGNLNFPIPGIAYNWNPHEHFRMNIGIPFSLHWQASEQIAIDMSYIPLTNVKAHITYQPYEKLRFYTGYEFLTNSYFLADRTNTPDRFFELEQRILGGVRYNVWRNAHIDGNVGYAFDRTYGEGANQGVSLTDRVDIDAGLFSSLALRFEF